MRVLSAYVLPTGERIWIITEADRSGHDPLDAGGILMRDELAPIQVRWWRSPAPSTTQESPGTTLTIAALVIGGHMLEARYIGVLRERRRPIGFTPPTRKD